jgi:Fic-DOC domain mobile mystery protein B
MNDLFEEPDDAKPLTPEEMRELIPAHISFRHELNQAEQTNIESAQDWALKRGRDPRSEKFVKELHRRMLNDVWRWAGKFRTSERNIGIAFYEIPVALRQLLDDAKAWIEYKTYPFDEIAVRFHHRLVQIHPFPNGNGRHTRLMADLLVIRLGGERFSWGKHQSAGCRCGAQALYHRPAGRRRSRHWSAAGIRAHINSASDSRFAITISSRCLGDAEST